MNNVLCGIFAVVAVVYASTVASACSLDGKTGIAPQNNLYIPASKFFLSSVHEVAFNAIVSKMENLYSPVLESQGRYYKVIADWNDGTVNAFARRNGKYSEVLMTGGLARHPKMTPDAFVLVMCHETGHHLGGSPHALDGFGGYDLDMANEGQADYYATFSCARKYWADEDNTSVIAKMNIPAVVRDACRRSFNSASEVALCQRTAMAGKDLGDTLGDLNRTGAPQFETPDDRVAPNSDYPNWDNPGSRMKIEVHAPAQCRLDTYFGGALCSRIPVDIFSNSNLLFGVCTQEKGDSVGVRPLCWYKPSKGQSDPTPTESGSTWPSSR